MDVYAILVALWIVGGRHSQELLDKNVDEQMFIRAILDGYDINISFTENFYSLLGDICPRSIYCTDNDTYGDDIIEAIENETNFTVEWTRNNTLDSISIARKILRENAYKLRGCCVQCSCDKYCKERRNCCPTMGKEFIVSADTDALEHPTQECVHASIASYLPNRGRGSTETGPAYYMVTDCHTGEFSRQTATKCRQPDPEHVAEVVPVYSEDTERIYKNKFCAECNDESNVTAWTPEIVFSQRFNLQITSPLTPVSIYTIARKSQRGMNIYFLPPPNSLVVTGQFTCTVPRESLTAGNICEQYSYGNIDEEQFFKSACKMQKHAYNSYRGSYNNVFCLLCAGRAIYGDISCEESQRAVSYAISALLRLDTLESEVLQGTNDTANEPPCKCSKYYDEERKKCRKLICPPGEYLVVCDCVQFLENISNVPVKIYLNFNPVLLGHHTTETVEGLLSTIENVETFKNKVTKFIESRWGPIELQYSLIFRLNTSSSVRSIKLKAVLMFVFKGNVDNRESIKDMFETLESGISTMIQNVTFYISLGRIFDIAPYFGRFRGIESYDEELVLMIQVAPSNQSLVLSAFNSAQTLNKLVFCKRVELDEDNIEMLRYNLSSLGMSPTYVDYVFLEEDGSMCLDDFERAFLATSSSAQSYSSLYIEFVLVVMRLTVCLL